MFPGSGVQGVASEIYHPRICNKATLAHDSSFVADAEGSIALGNLSDGISRVKAKLGSGTEREWLLPFIQSLLPTHLTVAAESREQVLLHTTGAAGMAGHHGATTMQCSVSNQHLSVTLLLLPNTRR